MNGSGGDQRAGDAHRGAVAPDPYSSLLVAADFLDDLEGLRKATAQRVWQLIRKYGDLPHECPVELTSAKLRDLLAETLPVTPAALTRWLAHMRAVEALEAAAVKEIERAARAHPLGAWIKATHGVGAKQGGRLLAATGDPLWNGFEDRPRKGVAEFRQFCGHGDPARSRRTSDNVRLVEEEDGTQRAYLPFSPTAKMRAHLIAEKVIQCANPTYRAVYDAAKASWEDRDVTPAHRHNHALRLVAKAILRDLYNAARDLRGADQVRADIQCCDVGAAQAQA